VPSSPRLITCVIPNMAAAALALRWVITTTAATLFSQGKLEIATAQMPLPHCAR
jgi:hypothetical protein